MRGLLSCLLVIAWHLALSNSAQCFDPSPAFPVPSWNTHGNSLKRHLRQLEDAINDIIQNEFYDYSSFSIELTSSKETIWSQFHSPRRRNETRPGAQHVSGNSVFRISAVTKVFTVLGLLQEDQTGRLSINDPVTKFVPELGGAIAWNNITLRTLASQLSGIPREFAHSDLINQLPDPVAHGLPMSDKSKVPACDEYNNYLPCKWSDLIQTAQHLRPVFAPNEKSTYSNVAFELIGLVLERVSGQGFNTYMRETVFDPLGMDSTSGDVPLSDDDIVFPVWSKGSNYWGIDEGVQNSTAGLYSTSSDLSRFLRYVLSNANAITHGINWLMPASWSTGPRTFYGMPWEILRTEKILRDSQRLVTFVTKSGGMPGYYSRIVLMPEYGLGLTILVGGETQLLSELLETITTNLVRFADAVLWEELSLLLDGTWVSAQSGHNSSIVVATSPKSGVAITSFISNDTDVLRDIFKVKDFEKEHMQLIPTAGPSDASRDKAMAWRMITVPNRTGHNLETGVWEDLCGTDVDTVRYAGVPANEFIFWPGQQLVELPAWNLTLRGKRATDGYHVGLIKQY